MPLPPYLLSLHCDGNAHGDGSTHGAHTLQYKTCNTRHAYGATVQVRIMQDGTNIPDNWPTHMGAGAAGADAV